MNLDDQLLSKLKQVVLENIDNEQFNVEHLSKVAGVSRSHLHRRLKKLKDQSISQFIREIRLNEALKLLHDDVATTAEIAYRVGFSSPSYFHKCFHEYYGYPPSEAKQIKQHEQKDESLKSKPNPLLFTNLRKGKKKRFINFKIIAIFLLLLFLSYVVFDFINDKKEVQPVEKSIAVLPFKNLSEIEENQHFADGLVEDLLNRLSTVKEFKVISRTSSDTYRERGDKKAKDIATELGVSYIVEGSVQKYDDNARITIQLIDAINDDHVWIKTFDRKITDVFTVQSEIAVLVAKGLSSVLTNQQTIDLQKSQTENVKAFELYQLGRFYWGKRLSKEYITAINYFEKAIIEDPEYALAYAGLGDTYFLMTWQFSDINKIMEYRNKAEEKALKALKLDESLVEAYTVLATTKFFIDWNWQEAEQLFKKAFELNANYSNLHHRYSEHLTYTGRHKEARNHINRAIELDPLSHVIRRVSTNLYFNQGQFEKSLKEAQISFELNQNNPVSIWYKFLINMNLKNEIEVLNNLKQMARINGNGYREPILDSLYNTSGIDALIRWKYDLADSPIRKAHYAVFLGEDDIAMDWLEEAFNNGSRMGSVPYWYTFKNLHSNPRFIAILNQMNLPWSPETSK